MHHGCIYSKTKQTSIGTVSKKCYSVECIIIKCSCLVFFPFYFSKTKGCQNGSINEMHLNYYCRLIYKMSDKSGCSVLEVYQKLAGMINMLIFKSIYLQKMIHKFYIGTLENIKALQNLTSWSSFKKCQFFKIGFSVTFCMPRQYHFN